MEGLPIVLWPADIRRHEEDQRRRFALLDISAVVAGFTGGCCARFREKILCDS
jgi:hypothetical protein